MAGLSENIKSILAGAPELVSTPGLTFGLAQGLSSPQVAGTADAVGVGQTASLAASAQGEQQAQQAQDAVAPKSSHHGLFGAIEGAADAVGDSFKALGSEVENDSTTALSRITKVLNYPLSQVQHYYRAVHDQWTRYGVFAGLRAELAPMGSFPSPSFAKSWKITSNGTAYRDVRGNAVNPGYDLANVIDHMVNGHGYMPNGWTRDENGVMQPTAGGGVDLPTGIINGVFDLMYDPTLKTGAAGDAVKMSDGLIVGAKDAKVVNFSGDAATKTRQLMDLSKSGQAVSITADGKQALVGGRVLAKGRVPRALIDYDGNLASNIPALVANNPGIQDAFGQLAGMNSEQILATHPMFSRTMVHELGQANDIGDVSNVFEKAMTERNYQFAQSGLPSTSLTRRMLQKANISLPTRAGMAGAATEIPGVRAAVKYRPFNFDSRTLQLSGKEIDPDGEGVLHALRSTILTGQTDQVANRVLADYVDAPDLGSRINIINTAFRDTVRAFAHGKGLTDDQIATLPAMQRINADLDFMTKNAMRPVYATFQGKPLYMDDPETGEPLNFGIWNNQTGKIALPDFNELRRQVADVTTREKGALNPTGASARNWLLSADDWVYNHYTTRVFKNLALLSMGFAFRVAAGELTPAIIQNGGRNVFGAGLMGAAAKLNPGLRDLATEYGDDSLRGVVARTLGGDVSKIAKVEGRNVTLANGEVHQITTLDALHGAISDDDIRDHANSMGIEIAPKEIPHYKAAIGKALYGVGRGLVDPDYYDSAVRNVMTLDGHLVAPGLSSNHDVMGTGAGPAEDLRNYLEQAGARQPNDPTMLGDGFKLWNNSDNEHPMFWHFAAKEASKDAGAQKGAAAYLAAIRSGASTDDATHAFTRADMDWITNDSSDEARRTRTSMALRAKSPAMYSETRAKALRGLIEGDSGKVHTSVLEGIAGEREVPSIAELARTDVADRPRIVKGRELVPIPHTDALDRMTQWGWRRFLHPTINSLSRAPIYTMKTAEEYKILKPWVDAGRMDPMEAHQIAQVRAADSMLPLIHNTKLRSQMSDVFRNVAPFYFAQEQAYKRYGRVIAHDLPAFNRAYLGVHAIANSGLVQQDANGNRTIVLPGASELSKWATLGAGGLGVNVLSGIPSVISGDTISLRSVAPTGNLPSVSPLVAVPLKEIQNHFPATEPFISKVIGGVNESESATDQLIPSATLKRALQATPLLDRESGFSSAYLNALAYAAHQRDDYTSQAAAATAAGETQLAARLTAKANSFLPPPTASAHDKQAALDRIKNSTRIMALVKTAVGAVSPLSPVMDVGDVQLRAEVQADITKYGLAQGLQVFLDKNPNATADTVFQSDDSATGTALPATKAALNWVQSNRGWVQSHPEAAAYLIPQTPQAFDVEAYNQELAAGLRAKKSPDQMLTALYAAATDPAYYKSLTEYENMRTAAAGDSFKLQQLSEAWATYKQGLASANPVWALSQDAAPKVETAQIALYQLQSALSDPKTPKSPQATIASSLIRSYNDYLTMEQQIRSGQSDDTLTDLQNGFNTYLDGVVQQNPAASALVTGVFRRLVNAD